jgi:hypothetical protein
LNNYNLNLEAGTGLKKSINMLLLMVMMMTLITAQTVPLGFYIANLSPGTTL